MVERICSVTDCERPVQARGMCNAHYHQARKRGELEIRPRKPRKLAGPGDRRCTVDMCDGKYLSRGLCAQHYGRAYRAGSLVVEQPTLPLDRHALTNVDRQAKTAHCSICGPCTPIRFRTNGVPECNVKRRKPRPTRARKGVSWQSRIWSTYKLTSEDYAALLAAQNGQCAICGEQPGHRLRVDHCHSSGRVRGLLCHACNVGLGWFRDNPDRLRMAIDYLT